MAGPPDGMKVESDRRVEALRGAVDAAVQQLRAATFTLVSGAIYLFLTGLGTGDRDLLVGRVVILPLFNANVGLLSFYKLAPVALLILHFTVLTLCYLVAERLRRLQDELDSKGVAPTEREFVLGLLYPYPLVERLAKLPPVPIIGVFLSLSVYVPLIIVPVCTLFWLQLRFLPYQQIWITPWHSFLLLVDIGMIWLMWPQAGRISSALRATVAAVKRKNAPAPEESTNPWTVAGVVATAFTLGSSLALSLVLVVFSGLGWMPPFATLDLRGEIISAGGQSQAPADFMVLSATDLQARLVMLRQYRNQTPEDLSFVADVQRARSSGAHLPARRLRKALLSGASLIGADLTGADLRGADLDNVDLRGAILRCADLRGASFDHARLEATDMSNADARGADFPYAELQGAVLHGTDFTGADLEGAHIQFVSFTDRVVDADCKDRVAGQGATRPPIFRGAIMKGAQLQGTPLGDYGRAVRFTIDAAGADLRGAQLHGVNLSLFDLTAADLSYYQALPSDDGSRAYMCDNALALAACGAPQGRTAAAGQPPGFAQLCYDAARIVTVDTLRPIGKKLACLFPSSDAAAATTTCASGSSGGPAPGAGVRGTLSPENCSIDLSPPAADGAHAVRDILTFLKEVAAAPKTWCGKDAPDDDRRLYLRAFVHRIYDYRCQYRRAFVAAGSGGELLAPGPDGETRSEDLVAHDGEIGKAAADIFAACGLDVQTFATNAWSASCNGPIPKSVP